MDNLLIPSDLRSSRKYTLVFLGFPSGGGGNPITGGGKGGFKDAKNDLIAELKLSHHIGGISKLKCEQQRHQEEIEKEQYQRFLSQFTMENFLEKVSNYS